MRWRLLVAAVILGGTCASAEPTATAPKKLLVVSVSTRNRFQNSVDVAEKLLDRLATQSHAFTIDYLRQPAEGMPHQPKAPTALKPDANAEDKAKFDEATKTYAADQIAYPAAKAKFDADLKQALEKMSPESLKNYDAVVFCYTTGNLPLPDRDAFINWVKAGHAFIGFGSAFETMNSYPPYYDMLGGRWVHFKGTQGWVTVDVINKNSQHPANTGIPAKWPLKEFTYKFPNYTLIGPEHSAVLLALDKNPVDQTPGDFPMAWCRDFGQGRVFYTALGGNPELWGNDAPNPRNPPETAKLFQTHILNGILWALNLKPSGA